MRSIMRLLIPAATVLAAGAMADPALATESNFASYADAPNASFVATQSGGSAGTLTFTDTSVVEFSFDETALDTEIGTVKANFTLTTTSSNSDFSGTGTYGTLADQEPVTGSFSFTSTTPLTVGGTTYAIGSNLLTGTFDDADFNGRVGGSTASFTGDSHFGSLVYTSDFLSFAETLARGFSMSPSSVVPLFVVNSSPQYIDSFKATPAGTFGSDAEPTVISDVPEPATWAMMLVGLGAIGLSLRGIARRPARGA